MKFLKIYCPSKESTNGKWTKHTSGNKKSGKKVPGICRKNKTIPIIKNFLVKNNTPISTSQNPKKLEKFLIGKN